MPPIKFCPQCNSKEITLCTGGITGLWWCKACGYRGPIVIEQEKFDEKSKRGTAGKKALKV